MKFSIIIPVYNCAPYIEACLDSIMAQSFSDFEVIIVDDHGTDNSIDLVHKYVADKNAELKYQFLQTEVNSGPGIARNVGIKAAQGEYVVFVDSDDTIDVDFLKELYEVAALCKADLAYCNALKISDSGQTELCNPSLESGDFTSEKKKYFLTHFVSMFWTFAYKRQLLVANLIEFPPERSAEDTCFQSCAILAASTIAFVGKPMYRYYVRSGSLSQKVDDRRYIDKMNSLAKMSVYAKQQGYYDRYKVEIDYLLIKKAYLVSVLIYIRQTERPNTIVLDEIYNKFVAIVPDYAENAIYGGQRSLQLIMFALRRMPRMAIMLLSLYLKHTKKMIV